MATRDNKPNHPPDADSGDTLPPDRPPGSVVPAFALPKRPPSLADVPPDDAQGTQTGDSPPGASDFDDAASTVMGTSPFAQAPKPDPTATLREEGSSTPAWQSQSVPAQRSGKQLSKPMPVHAAPEAAPKKPALAAAGRVSKAMAAHPSPDAPAEKPASKPALAAAGRVSKAMAAHPSPDAPAEKPASKPALAAAGRVSKAMAVHAPAVEEPKGESTRILDLKEELAPAPAAEPAKGESTRILDLKEELEPPQAPVPAAGAFSRQQAAEAAQAPELAQSEANPVPAGITVEQKRALLVGAGLGLALVLFLALGTTSFRDLPSPQELYMGYPYGEHGQTGPHGERAPGATDVNYRFREAVDCANYDKCVRYDYSAGEFEGSMILGKQKSGQWERTSDEGMPFRPRVQLELRSP